MVRIRVVEETQADGALRDAFAEIEKARGRVANVFKSESLNPAVMRAHLDVYMAIMYGKSGLSRQQREMIAVAVSNANACTYCTTHHSEALSKYLKDDAAIRAIKTDYSTAPIGTKEKAMISYALKVTRSPRAVNDADIEELRERDSPIPTSSTLRSSQATSIS